MFRMFEEMDWNMKECIKCMFFARVMIVIYTLLMLESGIENTFCAITFGILGVSFAAMAGNSLEDFRKLEEDE